jgi:hypothetical protein
MNPSGASSRSVPAALISNDSRRPARFEKNRKIGE